MAEPESKEEDKGPDNCGHCKQKVRAEDNGLNCDACKLWFHCGCQQVNIKLYSLLSEYEELSWYCKRCKSDIKQKDTKIKKMEERNKELTKDLEAAKEAQENNRNLVEEMHSLKSQFTDMKQSMLRELTRELKDFIRQEIAREIKDQVQILPNEDRIADKAADKARERIREEIKEEAEKEKKRKNLVIYKAPEPVHQSTAQCEKEDESFCQDLFENSLEIAKEDFKIEKVIRLGKTRTEGRSRPLLVRLREEQEKWHIIKNAKNLKFERDPLKKQVALSLDKTPREREADRMLYKELQERRSKGETGLYIKNGKLFKAREVSERAY